MQFIIKTGWFFLFIPCLSLSQSTYLPQGNKHQVFLDRLEIMLQNNTDLNLSTIKPHNRRTAVSAALYFDSINENQNRLSASDRYNMTSFLMNNREWVTEERSEFISKRSIWNTFFKSKANLLEVNEPDFFLAVNPVVQQQQSIESNNDQRVFLNSKGVTVRGLIARKLGFSAYITDNQERAPLFVQDQIAGRSAVPGVGFYKRFKQTGVDYFDARGSIHFNVAKFIEFQFGYDKMFIGNGYRSLFISDFGNSFLFLRINTKIWKLQYQNIFTELIPQYRRDGIDDLLHKKYASMHHLSMNITRWLNLGIFEAVVFGRTNRFEFSYMNPIIFLRAAEQHLGSADNAVVGLDFKANVSKRAQFYGQLVLDEFLLRELRAGNGWWGNKFGLQGGVKYIDLFKIKNLDLQGEMNLVRPFTYSHTDSVANFTHYNQPLAHPFGANFIEAIGIVRYQPIPKLTGSLRVIGWKQGTDTGQLNNGTDIFKPNTTRSRDFGFALPSGIVSKGINLQFLISYEVRENLFLDFTTMIRRLNQATIPQVSNNTSVITFAVRWNAFRREYDY